MTTVETELLTIVAACQAAGNGGRIYRSGTVYDVSQTDGNWFIASVGTGSEPEPITNGYVTDGWSVHSAAAPKPAETLWVTLAEACADTGCGGVVRFSPTKSDDPSANACYTVGQDEDGDWTLTGEGYRNEPMSTFSVEERWTTSPLAEVVEPQVVTVAQFFDEMAECTFLQPIWDSYTQYIFKGWQFDPETDERFVRIVHARYMDYCDFKGEELQRNSAEWNVIKNDDGTPKVGDQSLRMALRHLGNARNDIGTLQNRVRELEASYQTVVSDFKLLNAHLGDYANRNHMCSDYEKQLWEWNDTFSAMKLVGRDKRYYVAVRIPFIHDGASINVVVESANGPEDARAKVEAMSDKEILTNLLEQGYLDYTRFDREAMFNDVSAPYC